jgi:hypothetical protein
MQTHVQVDKVADRASYMDVCAALRKQQDEEVALSQQLQVGWVRGGRTWQDYSAIGLSQRVSV